MSKFLKHNRSIPALVLLFTAGFPTATFSQTQGVNTILSVTGKVTVMKKQWQKPQPAFTSLTLSLDDRLEVAPKAIVKVYCSNLTQYTFKPGKHTISGGCPAGIAVIRLPNSNNDTLRNGGTKEAALIKLPYLITPRETKILTDRPQLRWNSVPGATKYTVKIDGINWETQTNKTEIAYSGEYPLQAGNRYRIVIETDNGVSSKSDDENVGFIILDAKTKKAVSDAVKTIQQQQLSPEEKGLILAQLYRSYDLNADAVQELEGLLKQGSQSISVDRLLGDTYLRIGLPQLARQPYDRALKAIGTENLPLQAEIQAGLGKTHFALGNESEATQWLQKAKAAYEKLGDSLQVRELDKQISSISGR
jgi:hypothetical protein